jgi:hypothetical protein
MIDRAKVTGFNEHQVAELARRAITPEEAESYGVAPLLTDADRLEGMPDYWTVANGYLPGVVYPWRSPLGELQWQLKPDVPQLDAEGNPRKYVFAKGFRPVLNAIRTVAGSDKALIVEGTHQSIAAGLYAPPDWSVYGIAGCRGWSSEGLPINDLLGLAGTTTVVVLDADMARNLQVWDAGQALAAELEMSGVTSVKFAQVTGGAKAGLDDVLGARPPAARADYVARLIAPGRTVEAKKVKKPSRDAAREAEREQARARRVEVDTAERAREEAEGRRRVDVSGDRLAVVNELLGEIKNWGDGRGLFNRGNALVRRHGDVLSVLNRAGLTDVITQSVRTGAPGLTGTWVDGWPDGQSMDNILARWRDFSPLDQLVAAPFVRADGSLCLVNGYDRASRTYNRMARGMAERLQVPEEPSDEDVRAAVKLLLEDWLVDFPFPTQADRANALALILTPFIRGQVDVVPIAVVDGNGPSAGKGLLAELITRLVLGTAFIPTPLPEDNDEVRKAITGAMLAGSPMLIWDEAHTLEGTALAQLLTAPVWSDRRLGVSEMVVVPNRVTFVALGNNVAANGDIGRRAYRVRIHPLMERPEDRTADSFRHPDIKTWTEENRAELLSAVLVLIRAWHLAGRPAGPSDFGSFEKWSRMVGGILLNAGVPGFLEGRREWLEHSNATVDTWATHLVWLADSFKGRTFRAQEVAQKLVQAGSDAPVPSDHRNLVSPENTVAYAQRVGRAYSQRVDQTFHGLTLVRAGKSNGYQFWKVTRVEEDKTDMGTFTPPSTDGVDKTDTSTEPSGDRDKTDASGTSRGGSGSEGVLPPYTYTRAAARGETAAAHIRIGDLGTPSPSLIPLGDKTDTYENQALEVLADPDQYLEAEPYESRCDQGHLEVLVDGLWYACPVCHPATARVTPAAPEPDPFAD